MHGTGGGALSEDAIPLTAADPDFQVAPEIREAVNEIGSDGVFSYARGACLYNLKITQMLILVDET